MKISVAVFFGGMSTEHEISCISANQALHALDQDKYDVLPIYISKNNDFYTGDLLFDLSNYYDLKELESKLEKVSIYKDGNKVYVKPIKSSLFNKNIKTIDVAFPVVHGSNIEDGSLSGFLEMLNIPYTSSNVLGSALGQDKVLMKNVLKAEDINMVPWFYLYEEDLNDFETIKNKANEISYPLICKPANLGSSIGIEVIHNEDELKDKISECFKYDFKVVIEKMIRDLKEVNISVMNIDGHPKTSVIEEVLKGDELLSFKDKYEKGQKGGGKLKGSKGSTKGGMASLDRIIPANIDEDIKENIEKMALKAYRVLNADGVVRIDFMIDKNDNGIYINEINNIPGSLAFYLWDKEGIDFSKECDILINNAIKRFSKKEKKTYSFETNILANYRRK